MRLGRDGLGRTPYLQLGKTWDDLGRLAMWRLQENTGWAYWLVSLLGIHLFPTILVFIGCIGMIGIAEH